MYHIKSKASFGFIGYKLRLQNTDFKCYITAVIHIPSTFRAAHVLPERRKKGFPLFKKY